MAEIPFVGGPWGNGGAAPPSGMAPAASPTGPGAAANTPMDAWVDHVGTWNDVLRKHASRPGLPSGGELLDDWKRLVESWFNIWVGFTPWGNFSGWFGHPGPSTPTLVFLPDDQAECCDPKVIDVPDWVEEAKFVATPLTRLRGEIPVEPMSVTLNLTERGRLAVGLENVFRAEPGDYVSFVYTLDGPFRTPLAVVLVSKSPGEVGPA